MIEIYLGLPCTYTPFFWNWHPKFLLRRVNFFPLRNSQKGCHSRYSALPVQSDSLTAFKSRTVCTRMEKELEWIPWLWSISSCSLGLSIYPLFHPFMSLVLQPHCPILITWYSSNKCTCPFRLAQVHFCCLQPSNPNRHTPIHPLTVLQHLVAGIEWRNNSDSVLRELTIWG